jgi:hypothetical protein
MRLVDALPDCVLVGVGPFWYNVDRREPVISAHRTCRPRDKRQGRIAILQQVVPRHPELAGAAQGRHGLHQSPQSLTEEAASCSCRAKWKVTVK